ncbi:MAG: glycosyltransferase family 2 protein [Clostridiales bacterium]|nr:glycosyltransferase family 2 protein [Clostridiales bacterium]
MADLTVVILTKNEEQNLRKCVESLRGVVRRVVVVDSGSTDGTVEIARELDAEVCFHPFESHSTQFNWALKQVSTTWVMKLDADEELTAELAQEIEEKLDCLPEHVSGVILRRRVYFMGRWLKHGGKYPELLLRIFRVGHGMSEERMMDEHLIVTDGDVVTFAHDFLDDNRKTLEWWVGKHNWYSGREVIDQCAVPESTATVEDTASSVQAKAKRFVKEHGYFRLAPFLRSHLYLIYRYYIRLGFLDGREGKIYTFLQAYWYRFLVDAKLYEREKRESVPETGCAGAETASLEWRHRLLGRRKRSSGMEVQGEMKA